MTYYCINVEITGKTPLLMNRFTESAQMAATDMVRSSVSGDKGTPREQADMKLYRGLDGTTIVVPQPNLFRCILDAGKYFKAGKSKITTLKSSLIPSCVDMPAAEYVLLFQEPWSVDSRPVRNPATGGRFLTHRAAFHEWSIKFEVVLDGSVIAPKLFRDIVDKAGSAIGLGDFRPDCKGPFGKFVVTRWDQREAAHDLDMAA